MYNGNNAATGIITETPSMICPRHRAGQSLIRGKIRQQRLDGIFPLVDQCLHNGIGGIIDSALHDAILASGFLIEQIDQRCNALVFIRDPPDIAKRTCRARVLHPLHFIGD